MTSFEMDNGVFYLFRGTYKYGFQLEIYWSHMKHVVWEERYGQSPFQGM
jgi:hypothetical protein